jgi:hypothetical protein
MARGFLSPGRYRVSGTWPILCEWVYGPTSRNTLCSLPRCGR